jgi:hypothetical protein
MISFKFVAALTFAACATAGAIQEPSGIFCHDSDALDGFYIHTINSTGQPENLYVGNFKDFLPGVDNTTDSKTRRDTPGAINCHNQYTVNYSDLVASEQGLEQMYQYGGSFYGKSTSYKSGSAVSYGCNYGNGQTISGSWLAAQFGNIAQNCGSTGAGYVSYPSWKASYGVDGSGVSFC